MQACNQFHRRQSISTARRAAKLLALLAVCSCVPALADPTLPTIPNNTYNVDNYGAVGNSSTNDTTAIQDAINAASQAGGGTVVIPASGTGTFLSNPITLASNINLQINGELQMEPYGTYTGSGGQSTNFINATNLSNVEISGTGAIDGQGSAWWTAYDANNSLARPQMIEFSACSNVEVTGVTLQNPPNTHLDFKNTCSNVTVTGITINTPTPSPNTDGIDISASNALITNCHISDGDDNIAIGGSSASSSNITITNDTFGVGHGLSIGSYTSGGVNGLTVNNCTFNGTTSGIRMKSARGRGGLVENLSYSNITMTNVENPISIESYYPDTPSSPSADPAQPVTSTTPIWQNISISNLVSTDSNSNSNSGTIWGLPEEYVDGVTLDNVDITAHTGMDIYNATGVDIIDSNIDIANEYDANVTISAPEPAGLAAVMLLAGGLGRRRRA